MLLQQGSCIWIARTPSCKPNHFTLLRVGLTLHAVQCFTFVSFFLLFPFCRYYEAQKLCSAVQVSVEKKEWTEALELCQQAEQKLNVYQSNKLYIAHVLHLPAFLRKLTAPSMLYYALSIQVCWAIFLPLKFFK